MTGADYVRVSNPPPGQYWCFFGSHYVPNNTPAGSRDHSCLTCYRAWIAERATTKRTKRTPAEQTVEKAYQAEYYQRVLKARRAKKKK